MVLLLCCEGHNLLAPKGLLAVCPVNGLIILIILSKDV